MCRFSMSQILRRGLAPSLFFAGTLTVNLLGCLLIGITFGWVQTRLHPPVLLQAAVQAGFLGGFTTYSSFGLEAWQLWKEQSASMAVGYVLVSLIVGLGMVILGVALAKWMWGS